MTSTIGQPRRGKLIDYTQRGRCLDKKASHLSTPSSSSRSLQPVCQGRAERRLSNDSSSSEDVLPILDLAFEHRTVGNAATAAAAAVIAHEHRPRNCQDLEADQEDNVSFYLKIPSKQSLRACNASKSDLRERFCQRRGNSSKKGIIQSILDNSSTH